MDGNDDPLIRTEEVQKHFGGERGLLHTILGQEPTVVRAVDGISIEVNEGEIIGIAGESGCGKTTLSKLLMNLYKPSDGEIYFKGQPFGEMDQEKEHEFHRQVQMIFQDPFDSLNPRFTVMDAVSEPLKVNDIGGGYYERREMVIDALTDARLTPAEEYLDSFPRELSGGEQQRVAIARALVLNPEVIIADEPVSMLDVSIRASVLNLLQDLREEYDLTYIFVSHDLSLIRYICDRTAIMYLGDVVEIGETEQIITAPKHPYTQMLLDAVPHPDPHGYRERVRMEGDMPSPENPPSGCKFHPRCPEYIGEVCKKVDPDYYATESGQQVTCHLYDQDDVNR